MSVTVSFDDRMIVLRSHGQNGSVGIGLSLEEANDLAEELLERVAEAMAEMDDKTHAALAV